MTHLMLRPRYYNSGCNNGNDTMLIYPFHFFVPSNYSKCLTNGFILGHNGISSEWFIFSKFFSIVSDSFVAHAIVFWCLCSLLPFPIGQSGQHCSISCQNWRPRRKKYIGKVGLSFSLDNGAFVCFNYFNDKSYDFSANHKPFQGIK